MSTQPTPSGIHLHRPLTWLAGLLLLALGLLAGNAPGTARATDTGPAQPAHHAGPDAGGEPSSTGPLAPYSLETAPQAAETSAEGDDLPNAGAAMACLPSMATAAAATAAAANTADRRWRRRGQAPPPA